jgi:two-component system response regulator YesN
MYKVFIVDDEALVIKSLKGSVDWQEYGFEVIGEAYNGIEAYEKILQIRPDIVFTDIRMPGLNGLELIKKVKETCPNTKFVVVSAYAEFAYAQRAMSYGALGYCLKPFDDIEIISMLKKAKEILDKAKELLEMDIFAIIEGKNLDNGEKLKEIFDTIGFQVDERKGVIILVSVGADKLEFCSEFKYFSLKIGSSKYIYLINYYDQREQIKEYIRNNLPENVKGVGIGRELKVCNSLKENIDEASIAAYQFFMTGERGVYELGSYNTEQLNSIIKRLEEVINSKNIVLVQNILDDFADLFKQGIMNTRHAFIIYNIITSSFYRLNSENTEGYIFSIEQLMDLFHSGQDMLEYFKDIFIKYLSENKQYIPDKIRNGSFRQILKFINDNFNKDISLQSISQSFTINPSYISQLFKKELGITFTEYLTKLRISFASELLKTTDLTVGEISEKAGYIDYFYFTRTFKKVTSKTPSQYRNS